MNKYQVGNPSNHRNFQWLHCNICNRPLEQYQYYTVSTYNDKIYQVLYWYACSEECVTFVILSDLGNTDDGKI